MTNNKQQTAVEWLEEMYNSRPAYEEYISYEEFEQAKEMEKEQKSIKLPSEEEIYEQAKSQSTFAPSFIYGAEWMRNKIIGGNK
jgi:hypothetical protein